MTGIADGGAEGMGFRTPAVFLSGLGAAQVVSWGTLIYAFPVLAGPMAGEIGWSRTEVYLLASLALAVGGLAAYPLGAAIDRGHGRAIMAGGSALAALALWAWSAVPAGWPLAAAFAGIGLAQAMTLYEPAFAVVARRYGTDARRGITTLTLWGGFASTVFVPVTQLLMDGLGWRGALEVLAAMHLFLCLPLHLAVIDRRPPRPPAGGPPPQPAAGTGAVAWALRQPAFWALAVCFTVYYAAFSGLTLHLYPLLAERGMGAAEVVAAIALIGPAQVGGRLVVAATARRASIRGIGIATTLVLPVALALLLVPGGGLPLLALFALLYGGANGIMTIVRGAVVPELLTAEAYGAVNGLLAAPTLAVRAAAPTLVALLWAADGSYDAVIWATLAACVTVVLSFLAAVWTRPKTTWSAAREP
ncbi:MAG TPA: MFS transporter [Azospirillaceae bacterium]|nr:MFS transporter [Azospirillaceae bacterium]